MSNSKIRAGWHNEIALLRVIEFMAAHDHNATTFADMVDHDQWDARLMWMLARSTREHPDWVDVNYRHWQLANVGI